MSNFDYCPTCKVMAWNKVKHICQPRWQWRWHTSPDIENYVFAFDAEFAAMAAAERYNDDCSRPSTSLHIWVRASPVNPGEGAIGPWRKFVVEAEYSMDYTATEGER